MVLCFFLEIKIWFDLAVRGVDARVLDAPTLSRINVGGGGDDNDSEDVKSDPLSLR